jgi:hypothetical protein
MAVGQAEGDKGAVPSSNNLAAGALDGPRPGPRSQLPHVGTCDYATRGRPLEMEQDARESQCSHRISSVMPSKGP